MMIVLNLLTAQGNKITLVNKKNVINQDIVVKIGHYLNINNIVSFNDGTKIATASMDNTIKVWNTNTDEVISEFVNSGFGISAMIGTKKMIHQDDGTRTTDEFLLIAGTKNKITIWETGKRKIIDEWNAHNGWINSISLTDDGKYIITTGEDGSIKRWHVENNMSEWSSDKDVIEKNLGVNVLYAVADTQNQKIYAGLETGEINVLNFETLAEEDIINLHSDKITKLIYSKEDGYLYSSSEDGTLNKIDTTANTAVTTIETGYPIKDFALDISKNSIYLISNNKASYYTLSGSLARISSSTISDDENYASSITIDTSNSNIFVGSLKNQTFNIRKYASELNFEKNITAYYPPSVKTVDIAGDKGDKLISSDGEQHLYVWSRDNARFNNSIKLQQSGINEIKIIQEKNLIFTATQSNSITAGKFDDPENPQSITQVKDIPTEEEILSIDYCEKTDLLVFAGNTKIYTVDLSSYQADTGGNFNEELFIELSGDDTGIYKVVMMKSGETFFSVNDKGEITHWEISTKSNLNSGFTIVGDVVNDIITDENDTYLFAGTENGLVYQWNLNTGDKENLVFYDEIGKVNALCYLDELSLLFVGGERNELVAYDLIQKNVYYTLIGHYSAINDITANPETKQLAVASDDGKLSLWNYEKQTLAGFFGRYEPLAGRSARASTWLIYTDKNYYNTEVTPSEELVQFYDEKGKLVNDNGMDFDENLEKLKNSLMGKEEISTEEKEKNIILELLKQTDDHINNGRYIEAEETLKKIEKYNIEKYKELLPYYYDTYGDYFSATKKYSEALELYNMAIDTSKGSDEFKRVELGGVYKKIGDIYMTAGDDSKTRKRYNEANELYKKAKKAYDNAEKNNTDIGDDIKVKLLISNGDVLAKMGNVNSAISEYEFAMRYESILSTKTKIDLHIKIGDLKVVLGKEYLEKDNFIEANNYFYEAIKQYENASQIAEDNSLDAENAIIYGRLADVYFYYLREQETISESQQKNSARKNAIKYYKKQIPIIPEYETEEIFKAYNNLSEVYDELGNYDKAYEIISKKMELIDESNIDEKRKTYEKLAELCFKMNKYNYALEHLISAIKRTESINHQSLFKNHLNLGYLFYHQRAIQKAIINYKQSLKYIDEKAEFDKFYVLKREIALLYENTEEYYDALQTYLEIFNIIPSNKYNEKFENSMDLGRIYLKQNNKAKAEEYFNSARLFVSSIANINLEDYYLKCGDNYKKMNYFEEAYQEYKQAYDRVAINNSQAKVDILFKMMELYEMSNFEKAIMFNVSAINMLDKKSSFLEGVKDKLSAVDNPDEMNEVKLLFNKYFDEKYSNYPNDEYYRTHGYKLLAGLYSKLGYLLYKYSNTYDNNLEIYTKINFIEYAIESYKKASSYYMILKKQEEYAEAKYRTALLYDSVYELKKSISDGKIESSSFSYEETNQDNLDYYTEEAVKYYKEAITEIEEVIDNMLSDTDSLVNDDTDEKNTKDKFYSYFKNVLLGKLDEGTSKSKQKVNSYIDLFGNMLFDLSDRLRKERQYEKALEYAKKCLEILEVTDSYNIPKSLLSIGNIYYDTDDYGEAEKYYQNALESAKKKNNTEYEAKILNNLAIIKTRKYLFDEALELYHQSAKIKNRLGDFQGTVNTYWNIAILYERQTKFTQAINVINDALDLIKQYNLNNADVFTKYLADLKKIKERIDNISATDDDDNDYNDEE